MKQLFYALTLLAVVTSAYLKAVQLQDDAARNLALVMDDQRRTKPKEMDRSFEMVAKQVEQPAQQQQVVASTVTTTVSNDQTDLAEAETQLAELKLSPEIEVYFEGKSPAHIYQAVRRFVLIRKNPGYIRYEGHIEGSVKNILSVEFMEGMRVATEIDSSLTPEQRSEMGDGLQELKEALGAQVRAREDENRQQQTEDQNHEQQ